MSFFGVATTTSPPVAIPNKLFRFGEICTWFRHTFTPGETVTKHTWKYENTEDGADTSFEVNAVSWQLFSACAQDLDHVLWECSLGWSFAPQSAAKMAIGPLMQSTGSIGDILFPEERGSLERLAETAEGRPSEEMWRILTQGNSVGDTLTFQGRKAYTQIPISFPKNTGGDIILTAENAFELSAPLRIRVVLHGHFRRVITIA